MHICYDICIDILFYILGDFVSDLNLLILGAGQYGAFVKELAQSIEKYRKIDFLDDSNPVAIGKMVDLARFSSEYRDAIVAIGNADIRLALFEKLCEKGYRAPALISPQAYVSSTAVVGAGTVIEPMAVVQSGARIGNCCLIASGAVVKHNAVVEDGCYIDCNSVVAAGEVIPFKTKKTIV